MPDIVPLETIVSSILELRGKKVLIDRDIAKLYDIETRALKQAVRRNIKRFPEDFMFELTNEELINWRSQFVTSNSGINMGLRYNPMAFTEHGIAMLSSVLKSAKAIEINIQIIRAFVKMRELLSTNKQLAVKITELENKLDNHDETLVEIIQALKQLMSPDVKNKKQIGFKANE
jgi:phage regulator Rha-like protein